MKSTLETEWYLKSSIALKNGLRRHIFKTDNGHKIVIDCKPEQAVDRLLYSVPKGATCLGKSL